MPSWSHLSVLLRGPEDMTWYYGPFAIPYLLTGVVCLAIAILLWQRRAAPGVKSVMALMGATTLWAFAYVGELGSLRLADKLAWNQVVWVGAVSAPLWWFTFAADYAGLGLHHRKFIWALWLFPLVTLSMRWTNAHHGLVWYGESLREVGGFSVIARSHGPWYWLHLCYAYGLLLAGSLILWADVRRASRPSRRQSVALVASAGIPWLFHLSYLAGQSTGALLDITPVGLMLSGVILAWGVYRLELFDLLPAAREALIEQMADGWIVTDRLGRIVDVNRSARAMLAADLSALIGQPLNAWLKTPDALHEGASSPLHLAGELPTKGGSPLSYDLRSFPMESQKMGGLGALWVIQDVSEAHRLAQEREALIARLNATLSEVRRLGGLIPICAICKKVRDDSGYWTEVERYIADRSYADFSFALCPECQASIPEENQEARPDGDALHKGAEDNLYV